MEALGLGGCREISMRAVFAKAVLMLAAVMPVAHAQATGEGVPRAPGGKPDLQGVWTNASISSLERSAQLPLVLSEEQAKALEARRATAAAAGARATDPNAPAPKAGQDVGAYNQFWMDPGSQFGRIRGEPRSSWIDCTRRFGSLASIGIAVTRRRRARRQVDMPSRVSPAIARRF